MINYGNELSQDQRYTLDVLVDWFKTKNKKFITVGGFAGTGKTTIMVLFRKLLEKQNKKLKVAFVSYTGKATQVLKSTLIEYKSVFKQDIQGTIHSLIYSPIVDKHTLEIVGWEKKDKIDADLIIVDEASMVDETIWNDLLTFHIPIIAVGDHGQLPPVNGKFNLMQKPDLKLEQIHRQAAGNPIIELSKIARETGTFENFKDAGGSVKILHKQDPDQASDIYELLENYSQNTLVLCGYNFTRIRLNKQIRQNLGHESEFPERMDRVICLRNNHKKQIFNGMLGTIKSITAEGENSYYAEIAMDNDYIDYKGSIYAKQFNAESATNFTNNRKATVDFDLFDFGYALTVHKAQGSQADKVILFVERFKQMDENDWKKWLYTGITRAKEKLVLVI